MSDRTHYATIAKRVAKRIAAANNSCFLRQLDERSTDRAQRTEDRLRSLRTEDSHCKPLHLAKRLLIAPAKELQIFTNNARPSFFPRIYTATGLINESTTSIVVQTTSRGFPLLSLSLSDILRSRIVFNKD